LQIWRSVVNCGDLVVGYVGVRNDGDTEADLHQMARGQPSSEFTDDDDEQIIQCLHI
jgi:hypothetical protein